MLTQIGSGCFGSVHLAEGSEGQKVAVKIVLPDAGREMREVELLQMIKHPCVVSLIEEYKAPGSDGVRSVHIVMEFLPENLHQKLSGRPVSRGDLQVYSFQVLRALAHLDGMRICHRDLKPENILLDGPVLKLADFGSAKLLREGPSSSYICARWWRAPELIIGSSTYSTSVDWWSCGCVIVEMMLGRPLFAGDSSWGQMEAIVASLGAPTPQDFQALAPADAKAAEDAARRLEEKGLNRILARSWEELIPTYARCPEALELPAKLLLFNPSRRSTPVEVLLFRFFSTLSSDSGVLPLRIFDFTDEELSRCTPSTRAGLLRIGQK
jgi:glycogen synthase kinase 3 beta